MSTLEYNFKSLKLLKNTEDYAYTHTHTYIYIYIYLWIFVCHIANVDFEEWVQKLRNLWPWIPVQITTGWAGAVFCSVPQHKQISMCRFSYSKTRYCVYWHISVSISKGTLVHSSEGRNSSVGIATCYGLYGPGIESRWGQNFSRPSRPAIGPTQPPIQGVPGFSLG